MAFVKRQPRASKESSLDLSQARWKDIVTGVDFERRMAKTRLERTRSILECIDHRAASVALPEVEKLNDDSKREQAAIVLQKYIRAKRARKVFAARLYEQFVKEEEERMRKQEEQLAETDFLVGFNRMELELGDLKTLMENKQRRRHNAATIIQRCWRRFRDEELADSDDSPLVSGTDLDVYNIRINPFASVVSTVTVNAFDLPERTSPADERDKGQTPQAQAWGGGESEPLEVQLLEASLKTMEEFGSVFDRGLSKQLSSPLIAEDRSLGAVAEDVAPSQEDIALTISKIEAQLLSMHEMGEDLSGYMPGDSSFSTSTEGEDWEFGEEFFQPPSEDLVSSLALKELLRQQSLQRVDDSLSKADDSLSSLALKALGPRQSPDGTSESGPYTESPTPHHDARTSAKPTDKSASCTQHTAARDGHTGSVEVQMKRLTEAELQLVSHFHLQQVKAKLLEGVQVSSNDLVVALSHRDAEVQRAEDITGRIGQHAGSLQQHQRQQQCQQRQQAPGKSGGLLHRLFTRKSAE